MAADPAGPDFPTTVDAFLGGRVEAVQPCSGHHRAGLDAVLLAAALAAGRAGQVVELGAGTGVAGFCVAARVHAVRVQLVERDPELVACIRAGLRRPANGDFAARVSAVLIDITASEAARARAGLARASADAVIMNPPFRAAGRVRASPEAGRVAAHVLQPAGLAAWFRAAAHALKPGGLVVAIMAADALLPLLEAAAGRFGGLVLLPVHPRPAAPALRLLLAGAKGSRAAPSFLPGLVLHDRAGSGFAGAAQAILRDGAALGDVHSGWPF